VAEIGDRRGVDLAGLAVTGTREKHGHGHGLRSLWILYFIFYFYIILFFMFFFYLSSMARRVGLLETMLLAILSGYFLCL